MADKLPLDESTWAGLKQTYTDFLALDELSIEHGEYRDTLKKAVDQLEAFYHDPRLSIIKAGIDEGNQGDS